MKTLTDFCKTVETGVDPRLSPLQSRMFLFARRFAFESVHL